MERYNFDETTINISDRYLTSSPITEVFLKKDMSPLTGKIYALWRNGKLKFEISFTSGLANGTYKAWNNNGGLLWEFKYVKGIKHGEYKCWFDNGEIQTRGWYYRDKLDGPFQSWHKTGRPFVQAQYKNGLLHGQEKCFFQNGHESKENLIDQGECIDSKHFKHRKLQEWNGQRISNQLKLKFSHDYFNGRLKRQWLLFSAVTEKGAITLKESGLVAVNKGKGRNYLIPVMKVVATFHDNGFLKSEEIYETNYTSQLMLRRTWNENGQQLTFEKQQSRANQFFILKDVRNYFENKRIENEEISCYFKPFDKVYLIKLLNSWHENGRLKSLQICDSYNLVWVKKAWSKNGMETEAIINLQSHLS